MTPNTDQILMLVRSVLVIVGMFLVSSNKVTDSNWQTIAGAILTIVPVIWGMFANTQSAKIEKVAVMPEVTQVKVNTLELANSIPSPKVVHS